MVATASGFWHLPQGEAKGPGAKKKGQKAKQFHKGPSYMERGGGKGIGHSPRVHQGEVLRMAGSQPRAARGKKKKKKNP